MVDLIDTGVWLSLLVATGDEFAVAAAAIARDPENCVVSTAIILEAESWLRRNPIGLGGAEREQLLLRARGLWASCGRVHAVEEADFPRAIDLVSRERPLGALDALHAATALRIGARVVTTEKPTKPLFRVPGLKCVSIHLGGASTL